MIKKYIIFAGFVAINSMFAGGAVSTMSIPSDTDTGSALVQPEHDALSQVASNREWIVLGSLKEEFSVELKQNTDVIVCRGARPIIASSRNIYDTLTWSYKSGETNVTIVADTQYSPDPKTCVDKGAEESSGIMYKIKCASAFGNKTVGQQLFYSQYEVLSQITEISIEVKNGFEVLYKDSQPPVDEVIKILFTADNYKQGEDFESELLKLRETKVATTETMFKHFSSTHNTQG